MNSQSKSIETKEDDIPFYKIVKRIFKYYETTGKYMILADIFKMNDEQLQFTFDGKEYEKFTNINDFLQKYNTYISDKLPLNATSKPEPQ